MKRQAIQTIRLLALAAALGACTSSPPETPAADTAAPAAPSAEAVYTPVVSLNETMVYVVDPHANEIWDAATNPPKTDEQWQQLNRAAVTLATAGSLTKMQAAS